MNYYISDLHLSHTNVIKFDSRPYDTTEEMENYKGDANIIFVDQERWIIHEASFCGWKDNGSPAFSCDGKIIDNNEIFLWCTRYNLLEITNFVQMIEPLISFTNNKKRKP